MSWNLLRSTGRILAKYRLYTLIGVSGLALSLACILVLVRYIHRELTVNRFCPDLDRTYILTTDYLNERSSLGSNENLNNDPDFTDPLAGPQVEAYTHCIFFHDDRIRYDRFRYEVKTLVTDSRFLRIVPYPLLAGNGSLSNPTDAVITRRLARRLFGDADPLGKSLTYNSHERLTVVGVLGEPATKSSFDFDLLVSSRLRDVWRYRGFNLAVLAPGADAAALNRKHGSYRARRGYSGRSVRLQLFPFKKLYFDRTIARNEEFLSGNYTHILILAVVVGLLCIVGLFNYMNIYTVMMLKRAREFGVRKVYGATGRNVFAQLFAENLLATGAALFLAWFLVEATAGAADRYFGISRAADSRFDLLFTLGILVCLPFFTTVYPFLKYNYAAPSVSIRSVGAQGRRTAPRVVFLAVQYVITCVLIVVSLFFIRQLQFMLSADLGYDTDRVLMCRMFVDDNRYNRYTNEEWEARNRRYELQLEKVRSHMNECPYFSDWVYGPHPNELDAIDVPVKNAGETDYKQVCMEELTLPYMHFFGFKLKAGRLWNDSIDRWGDYKLIINESAEKLFGIRSIDSALLQPESRLWWSYDAAGMDVNPPYRVAGVVEDFRIGHLSGATPPLIILYSDAPNPRYEWLMARVATGKMQEAIAFLRRLHGEISGEGDFNYRILSDDIASMYREDRRVTDIYSLFALVAVAVSCLGLFGLSLFDLRQRYREIALRKVHGATAASVVGLVMKKYACLLGAVSIVSVPLAYYAIRRYLEGFAFRAPVSWWLFAAAIIVVAGVSFATLIWQVRKAAAVNPAEVLKAE